MRDELFEELLQSVREGGAILRGKAKPVHSYSSPEPDVAELREAYGLSQAQFAALLGISVRTLQNWEQGRRSPEGPARVLLRVAARHPESILEVVREQQPSQAASKKTPRSAVARKATAARRSRSAASYSKRSPKPSHSAEVRPTALNMGWPVAAPAAPDPP